MTPMSAFIAQPARLWRHLCGWRQGEADPLTHDVRAGEQVAQALGAGVRRGDEDRETPEGHPDLDEAEEPPDEGVPEPDRTGVVTHRPQAQGELAERPSLEQGLLRDRQPHQSGHEEQDRHRLEQGEIRADQFPRRDPEDEEQERDDDEQVDEPGRHAVGEAGRG